MGEQANDQSPVKGFAKGFIKIPVDKEPDYILKIKPDYAEIRRRYLRISLVIVILVMLMENIMFFVYYHDPEAYGGFQTSIPVYLLTYNLLPTVLNFLTLGIVWHAEKNTLFGDEFLNTIVVISMAIICSVTSAVHCIYSVTMAMLCIPIFMASVFGKKRLVYGTSAICLVGLAVTVVCRYYSPYHPNDMALIPETTAALLVVIISCIMSNVIIKMLEVQKQRLLNAVMEGENARREAQAANLAKTEFLANMSHEIRTPLNAVIGMTEMILRKSSEDEILEYAVDIQQAGNWLLAIISDILDISKIESGKIEIQENRYELGSLINDSYNMVAARCREKGLTMEITCDPSLPRMLYGDEYHLRQIVVNVLSNAVKYTNVGGVEFHVSGEKNNDILRMEMLIKDTGVGIRPEDIPHLYEKFSRFDVSRHQKVEGTGLGLSITKQLVDLMGGTIEVESVYGVGTAFTIRIPQNVYDSTPIGDVHATYLDMHGVTDKYQQSFEAPDAHILVVDDVSINLDVIRHLLEGTRIDVDVARSGAECLKKVSENKYDLILMDHMMPEMDGIETLQAMRAIPELKCADVPVIMLTANAMLGAREVYLEDGFIDYLAKPVRGPRLEAMILKYLPPEKVIHQPSEMSFKEKPSSLEDVSRLLPELDTVSGLSFCAEDTDFYLSMLKEFVSQSRIQKLITAYEQEDWAAYQNEAHSMKSGARMVGLPDLSDECLRLEAAAKERNTDLICAFHSGVVAHFCQISEALSSLNS